MKHNATLCALMLGVLLLSVGSAQALVFPATTDAEYEALVASSPQDATFIRTQQDFDDYKAIAVYPGTPLYDLTSQQLADWAATVWVVDGGLVSMDIGILENNLSSVNFANVLAAFGISVGLAKDYEDMYCEKRATCSLKYFSTCLSTC